MSRPYDTASLTSRSRGHFAAHREGPKVATPPTVMTAISPQRIRQALIVEDEGLLLDSLEKSLRRIEWLRISKAQTAELALGQIALDPPDVVITDVRMPGMGGLELLDQIRSLRPDVPVVVMTAYGVHLQREAMRRGATCFLEKPFRMSELRGVLQLLFASAGTIAPTPATNVNFEGRLESLSLADIVQVVCLSRQRSPRGSPRQQRNRHGVDARRHGGRRGVRRVPGKQGLLRALHLWRGAILRVAR